MDFASPEAVSNFRDIRPVPTKSMPAAPVAVLRYFSSFSSSRRRAASSMRDADLLRWADSLRLSHSVSRRT